MRRIILIIMLLLLAGLLFRVSAQTIDSEGVAYYKAGFPNAAKTLLLSEVGTSPSDARGYYYLGNIYFSENKADSASYERRYRKLPVHHREGCRSWNTEEYFRLNSCTITERAKDYK